MVFLGKSAILMTSSKIMESLMMSSRIFFFQIVKFALDYHPAKFYDYSTNITYCLEGGAPGAPPGYSNLSNSPVQIGLMVYALSENHRWSDSRGGLPPHFLKWLKLILREPRGYEMDITIIINPSFIFLRNFMTSSCLKQILERKTSGTVLYNNKQYW
jgi:hypothetical protein